MTRIGIVTSSTRPARVGPKVAAWVSAQAPEGVEVEVIDLGELDLPFFADREMPAKGNYDTAATKAWAQRVAGYDAVLFVVAQYNASYPAPVKNAIDSLYREWLGKPVGLIGYGWSGAEQALDHLAAVLRHVKTDLICDNRPRLIFDKTLTPDGEVLEGAPAEEVGSLLEALVEAAETQAAA